MKFPCIFGFLMPIFRIRQTSDKIFNAKFEFLTVEFTLDNVFEILNQLRIKLYSKNFSLI